MIQLRRFADNDRESVLRWRNLPSVRHWMYNDQLIEEEIHNKWFEQIISDISKRYWIIQVDGVPVGVANLTNIDSRFLRCDWAFYIAEDSARGKGVGAATEFIVLDYAFYELGLEKVCCEVIEGNDAVVSMHQNFGFAIEGTLRSHIVKDGRRKAVVALGMLKSEWEESRELARRRLVDRGSISPSGSYFA